MPNTRNQPSRALRNLLMKPDSVFAMIYDAVLRACHNHHRHMQFPIAALHCGHRRNHGGGVVSLGTDLRWTAVPEIGLDLQPLLFGLRENMEVYLDCAEPDCRT